MRLTKEEKLQEKHYDRIIDDYDAHYDDKYSQHYVKMFYYKPLFQNIPLNKNMKVLDAMAGGGEATRFLLSKGVTDITGLDISPKAVVSYKRKWKNQTAVCSSIIRTPFKDNTFDMVTILGGLHHVHPYVKKTMKEINRILKPGGYFCFLEPHSHGFLTKARKIWYKKDSMFADNEADINYDKLEDDNSKDYEFVKIKYLGGIAYFLVLNSLIFRIPLWLKRFYSYPLNYFELITAPVLASARFFTPIMLCQWQKKGVGE